MCKQYCSTWGCMKYSCYAVIFIAVFTISAWQIDVQSTILNSVDDYSKSEEQDCLIINYQNDVCRVGKNTGYMYTYTATAEFKCGIDRELSSIYNECIAKDKNPYDIGSNHTCWIKDCDEGVFVLKKSNGNTDGAMVWLVLCSITLSITGCAILFGFGFCVCIGPVYRCIVTECFSSNSEQETKRTEPNTDDWGLKDLTVVSNTNSNWNKKINPETGAEYWMNSKTLQIRESTPQELLEF
eukprot:316523_1